MSTTAKDMLAHLKPGHPAREAMIRQLHNTRMPAADAPKPSKYHNRRETVDGVTFASNREARRYRELEALRRAGRVRWFLMQAPFRLPGGTRYLADFVVVWADGHVSIEDVKGMRTATYKLKKREVEAKYGISITEI